MERKKALYIGIDTGGTHTDAVAIEDGTVRAMVKVPTQHENLPVSVQEALCTLEKSMQEQGMSLHHAQRITLGTTLGINALVQNALPPVGLFLTAGPGIHPSYAALGEHVVLVDGCLDHRGQEIMPLNTQIVQNTAQRWYAQGLRHFAVVGKFSPRNTAHEVTIATIIKDTLECPVHISCGHEMSGLLNFPRRVASAWFNAAVCDVVYTFLTAVENTLQNMHIAAPLYLLKADGGSMPIDEARKTPVNALLSGPAASVMGLMASRSQQGGLCTHDTNKSQKPLRASHAKEDVILLDIGGTTTDIAVFVGGVPVLERDGMQLMFQGQERKTHIRAIANLSLPIGGDSVVTVNKENICVGPHREGSAVAFGGAKATLLDALLVLHETHSISAITRQKSITAMAELAQVHSMDVHTLAYKVIEIACQRIYDGIVTLLARLNAQPVYTLAQLLEHHVITPHHIFVVGAPAHIMQEALTAKLAQSLKVTLSVPQHASVMNGLGAALTTPTAHLELFVDTIQKIERFTPARANNEVRHALPASLDAACAYAVTALQQHLNDTSSMIDIIEAQCFSILDTNGRSGKDMRVRCQVRPHIVGEQA